MKYKLFAFTLLVLACAVFLVLPVSVVSAQESDVSISSVSPETGFAGTQFSVTIQGSINTTNGNYSLYFEQLADSVFVNGTASGKSVEGTLMVSAPGIVPGNYNIVLLDAASGAKATLSFSVVATGIAAVPIATVLIMLVSLVISLANMGLNRALITKMIGWREYHAMQKEVAEHNKQRMAALRANDQKTIERLKKKDSQITAMQGKLAKPQMLLLPITFIYFIIWPILTGFFPFTVAYVPGFGAQPFFIWYMMCSFFFGTLASKIVGVTPIQ